MSKTNSMENFELLLVELKNEKPHPAELTLRCMLLRPVSQTSEKGQTQC